MEEASDGQHGFRLRERYEKEEGQGLYSGAKCPTGQGWPVDHGGGVAAKKVRAVGFGHRRQMIEPNLKKLSQRRWPPPEKLAQSE
jgi:hypothetical protein